ncbi:MAG: M20/M25/M40 family metallo-hydrolase [Lishizhenia sp.]
MKILLSLLFVFCFLTANSQKEDSSFVRKIYDIALTEGKAYEDLRSLCKDIGARLTGSAEAEMAVYWAKEKLESYGFDKVYLQPIEVPHWERGNKEVAWYKEKSGKLNKLNILALGGSVGTNGKMAGEIVYFNSLEALKEAKRKSVEGKIVFINKPFDQRLIRTGAAYGACWAIRGYGAIEASKLGAKAIIIRSLATPIDNHPHTGSMYYEDSVPKIPAAAISSADAEKLAALCLKNKTEFIFEMDCRVYPNTKSFNVIGEITGSKNPNNIITFGGHLDSWDVGEGAHDDGAGVVHSIEALRILKEMNYKPNNTLRCVLFMNEENGNFGGKQYAKWTKEKGENQVHAIESDAGGFSPRGFGCSGSPEDLALFQSFEELLRPYLLHQFVEGGGGVDIGPLKDEFPNIALYGLKPDTHRYFDYHHTHNDVFENVNKRELEMGAAAMSSLIYLLDKYSLK